MTEKPQGMAFLKQTLEGKLLTVLTPGCRVFFIDYPVHGNVGDILITKGTEAFFRRHRIKVVGRASVINYRFPPVDPDCTLVLQGGGNFGDLYEVHQILREQVVERFPHRKVVVLPQTIHFQSDHRMNESARIFRSHPDFHLFVRDERSRDYGERFSDNVVLCPDMATELWPIIRVTTPRYERLHLLRRDGEAAVSPSTFTVTGSKDWDTILKKVDRKLIRYLQKMHKRDRKRGYSIPSAYLWWRIYTDWLVSRVVREFATYEEIVTSRLHAHILACLMGKPNYVMDNSYGKNFSYYDAWTRVVPNATRMERV